MTEPKFTPGPWNGMIFSHEPKEIIIIDTERARWLASIENGAPETEANAHLIAAAPELYAELARIDPTNPVLAKARGE